MPAALSKYLGSLNRRLSSSPIHVASMQSPVCFDASIEGASTLASEACIGSSIFESKSPNECRWDALHDRR
jgi:hypothetical protein